MSSEGEGAPRIMGSLNGSTGMVFTAIAGAVAFCGTLLNQAYNAIETESKTRVDQAQQMLLAVRELRDEGRDARVELRADMLDRFSKVERVLQERELKHQQNTADIVALQQKDVEIETQFGAANTVQNLEKQIDVYLHEWVRQCPQCQIPNRNYYPPRPGPAGH